MNSSTKGNAADPDITVVADIVNLAGPSTLPADQSNKMKFELREDLQSKQSLNFEYCKLIYV